MAGSHSHQIARTLGWLKDNFSKPLRVSDSICRSIFRFRFPQMTDGISVSSITKNDGSPASAAHWGSVDISLRG